MASTIKVDTIQSTTSNVFFQNSAGTEYARFDASGNFGIGTASPASKFNIVDASATVNVRLESGSVIGQYFASSSGGGVFLDTASSHPLVFRINSTERMRIDTSGNVGIGTASPTQKLDVNGSVKLSGLTAGSGLLLDLAGSQDYQIKETSSDDVVQFGSNNTTGFRHNISSGNFQFNSGYGSIATAFGCRAWVNFDGTGTPAIRASGNVTNITDNGTGLYTVNLTTAMPDTNYCTQVSRNRTDGSTGSGTVVVREGGTYSANAVQIATESTSGTQEDPSALYVAIFR